MTQNLSDEQVVALAAVAVPAFPAASALTAGAAQPMTEHVTGAFAAAAAADLVAPWEGRLVVLVGPELTTALQQSPVGALDVAAALQPAFDAMAASLGASVGPSRDVDLAGVLDELGGPARAVVLTGTAAEAAVLVPDTLGPSVAPEQTAATTPAAPRTVGPTESIIDTEPAAPPALRSVGGRGIEMLHGVEMDVTVELGRTRMTVRELLALAPGTVLELDRAAGSPADLLVNGRLIARGEVVVVDEDFGLRITEVIDDDGVVQGRAG